MLRARVVVVSKYVVLAEAATTVERRDDVLVLRSPSGVLRFVP